MFRQSAISWGVALLLLGGCDRIAEGDNPAARMVASIAGLGSDSGETPAVASVTPVAETGREAFRVCSVCHGPEGEGTQLGPSLRDTTWIHIGGTPAEIANLVRTGVDTPVEYPIPMPVMGGGAFAEEELAALAAFVHALQEG